MNSTHGEMTLRLRVERRTVAAEGVVALDLRRTDGRALPSWRPGAHIDLELPGPLTRQYSLCGSPADRTVWRLGILREPDGRGGSAWIHEELGEGAEVTARGPRNHFELAPSPRYIFIAGGIGITPILPMMSAAAHARASWSLHYGGRTRASMAFVGLIEQAYGKRVSAYPFDEVGLIDLEHVLGEPASDTLVYCCGPEPLLKAVEQQCAAWPAGALRMERFAPKDLTEPERDGFFEIELAGSGMVLGVPPGKSILEVAEGAGVPVLSSCREGTCGTCETPVLKGEVDHRDSVLTPEQQTRGDSMLICVSRAACPRLVLDL
jgi:ferredoxin-NADP reductase